MALCPTATFDPVPAETWPLLTSLPLPRTAPSPLTMSPCACPLTTTEPSLAVVLLPNRGDVAEAEG